MSFYDLVFRPRGIDFTEFDDSFDLSNTDDLHIPATFEFIVCTLDVNDLESSTLIGCERRHRLREFLEGTPDTDQIVSVATTLQRLLFTNEQGQVLDSQDPAAHRLAVQRAGSNGDSWWVELLCHLRASLENSTAELPYILRGPLINFDHVIRPCGNGGWHFCPDGDQGEERMAAYITNPYNGVFGGYFQSKKGMKFSSFFPRTIASTEELLTLIQEGEPEVAEGNRQILRCSDADGRDFFIEVYLRADGLLVYSAFPLFFYGNVDPEANYYFTDVVDSHLALKGQVLLNIADEVLQKSAGGAVVYKGEDETGSYLVVDIAPRLKYMPGYPPRGIYLRIPVR